MVSWSSISCGIVVTSIFSFCASTLAVDDLAKQLRVDKDEGQCNLNHDESLDSMSLMQGSNLHIHFNGRAQENSDESANKNKMPFTPEAGLAPSLRFLGNSPDRIARKVSAISMQVHAQLEHRIEMLGGAGSIFLILFLLLGGLLCAICVCSAKRNQGDSRRHEAVMGQWHHPPHDVQRKPHSVANLPRVSETHPHGARSSIEQPETQEGPWSSLTLAGSLPALWKGTGASPSQASVQQLGGDRFSLSPRTLPNLPPSPESRILPPPLCPTLVLPVCEARFGILVQDLIRLASQHSSGELGIVGLSGNTLLRALLKSDRGQRMLEVSMPETNSAPRATVGPALVGARSLEIRGLRGCFYGTLEMRHSGACYVVKDGVTVLLIDGNTDDLELSVRSNQGVGLSSVRVSPELFGESNHVEIRVEPGVDTVLVLVVVLAVLLLSP